MAKKVSVFLIARTYGFPKLYRKMMRLNRRIYRNRPESRKKVTEYTQLTFRWPRLLAEKWRSIRAGRMRTSLVAGAVLLAPADDWMLEEEEDELAGLFNVLDNSLEEISISKIRTRAIFEAKKSSSLCSSSMWASQNWPERPSHQTVDHERSVGLQCVLE